MDHTQMTRKLTKTNATQNISILCPFFCLFICDCKSYFIFISSNAVHISMDTFVKRYQSEKYAQWRNGNDRSTHPEQPLLDTTAARAPLVQDVLINIKYCEIILVLNQNFNSNPIIFTLFFLF